MPDSIIRVRSLSGATVGKTWTSTETMQVGRTPGLPVFIDDISISRWHAEVALTAGGWVVRDMGSRNGSCVNGQLIGTEGSKVQPGDVLQFGNVTLAVETAFVANANRGSSSEDYQIEKRLLLDWEDLADVESQLSGQFPKGYLALLMRAGRDVRNMKTLRDCSKVILWQAAEVFAPEHAAILTVGEDANPLAVRESLDLGAALKHEWFVTHSLVLEAFSRGKSILGRDALGRTLLAVLLRTEKANRLGVLVLARNDTGRPFNEQHLLLADALALGASLSMQSFLHSYHRYERACSSIFDVLTNISQWQNPSAREEHQRVIQIALLLATEMELPAQDVQCLRVAIPLRNIGVLGLKEDLLSKKSALSTSEKARVRKHILKGIETLEGAPWMSSLIPIIRSCRERWDGSGYPDGLKGEGIPILARIVAAADALAAMMQERSYRKALTLDKAIAEIRVNRGTQFDPACVDILMRRHAELRSALVSHLDVTQTVSREDMQTLIERNRKQEPVSGQLGDTLGEMILIDQHTQE